MANEVEKFNTYREKMNAKILAERKRQNTSGYYNESDLNNYNLRSSGSEEPNFSLILVGDGPTRTQIEKKINDLGILKNVKVLGSRNDVPILMNIFDVFILPTLIA